MTVRAISFSSIPVVDQDRALAFYCTHLGFEVVTDTPYSGDWRWIFLGLPGAQTRLHFARTDELSWKEGMPVLTLNSANVDILAETLLQSGVEIVAGPDDAPWAPSMRYVLIRDSEGNIIYIDAAKDT